MSNILTAAVTSITVAVIITLSNFIINKVFKLDLGWLLGSSYKRMVIDTICFAVILFIFQVIILLIGGGSILYVFVATTIIASYPVLVRPYRLVKSGTCRNHELEEWLFSKTKVKSSVLISPKKFTNALADGVLPVSKVIVISQDLYENLTTDQLYAVLLHEAGHLKNKHTIIIWLFNVITAFIISLLIMLLLRNNLANEAPLLYFLSLGACGLSLYFAQAPIYKRFELAADLFASEHIGKHIYINTLYRLDELTSSGLSNNDFYHPSLKKRVDNVTTKNGII